MTFRFRITITLLLLLFVFSLYSIDWQTWRYGDIRVWSAPKDTAYANIIVKKLHQRINAFQIQLGVYPVKPLVIKILPNRKEYKILTSGKGKLVESSEAFYSPSEQIIYVRSPDQISMESYDNVLMHEYIHWFLDETLTNVPLWFHEGMAFYFSGQFNFQAYYDFTRYRFMGYHISLNDMEINYPVDKNYWNMFYLTSAFAISNLETKRNLQWQEFWNIVGFIYNRSSNTQSTKSNFIRVFNSAFQMSLFAFSKDYDKTLKRYGWQFPFVGINAIIFALLPLVIISAWLRNRRRMKSLTDHTEVIDNVIDNPEYETHSGETDTATKENVSDQ